MWKTKLLACVLLLSLLSYSHSQSFSPSDWNAVWNDVNSIELNLNLLKTENMKLENAYQEQVSYSAKQAIQLKDLEKSSRRWKTATIICGGLFLATTIVLITKEVNN